VAAFYVDQAASSLLYTLWEQIDELIEAQRFLISEEVWEEDSIQGRCSQSLVSAAEGQTGSPTDAAITAEVQAILVGHERLVMNLKGRSRSDPFVVALARVSRAVVVTGEGSDGTADRPKIPYACQHLGVQCVRFLDIIK
jgi:hypothetical protein